MSNTPNDNPIDLDVEALALKYAKERDKRKRTDGQDQFQGLAGRLSHLAVDPHADPTFTRDALTEQVDVLIIGGGFAGLLAGARLHERGIRNVRIIERGADFGGTWYWNRYPGAACDVEALIYLPLLEEVGGLPTERYPRASEIYAYCIKLGYHFELYPKALFQTQVDALTWGETTQRWTVTTDRGDTIAARFVISCTGVLSTPKLPRIPGVESFEGHAFHTSRWDYTYTGGRGDGKLDGLADKTVGIIGTGSTGIQVIPHLGAWAKQLYVFQRTPSSVDVRNNGPVDPALLNSLKPGWQKLRRDNFTTLLGGGHAAIDMVNDSWTDIIRNVAPRLEDGTPVADMDAIRRAEMLKMELTRRRVGEVVRDPATAEALKPYFNYFCKRPCFHDEYLDTFNRQNVSLVDTRGKGVERITPHGVVVDDREYKLDCLIFATGFDFLTNYCRESGFEVVGTGGKTLSSHWDQGPLTLYGLMTDGFPNFFTMSIAQAGAAVNYVHMADEQTQTIAHVITECFRRDILNVQPTPEAVAAWVEEVVSGSKGRRAFLEACTPGYYNYEGNRQRSAELNDFYPGGPMAYAKLLENWRASPDLPGLFMS